MLEDTATTEENQSTEEVEIEEASVPTHPYDMPGEWFVLNAQSGHEKKVKTNWYLSLDIPMQVKLHCLTN